MTEDARRFLERHDRLRSELVEARARLAESQAREATLREGLQMMIDEAAHLAGFSPNTEKRAVEALSTHGPSLVRVRASELKSLLDEMQRHLRPWIATASEDYQNGFDLALAYIEGRIVRFNDQAARLRTGEDGPKPTNKEKGK